MRTTALVAAALSLATQVLAGTQGIKNARIESRSAASGVAAAVKAEIASRPGPAWIGWSVPTQSEDSSCCWSSDGPDGRCRGCQLEEREGFSGTTQKDGAEPLESSGRVRILLRVEGARVGRVRAYSEDCPLDAGGLPLVWLEDVRSAESVAWLATQSQALKRVLREDEDRRLREHAIFALTQSHEPGAVDTIIEAARRDPDAHVRGQALFWLAQTASRRAKDAIRTAVDDDPEIEVKKKAVFALSQLPKDEGVPLLMSLARTHKSYEVRKQAMFWLGQSGDPRALAFFVDVLKQ